MASVSNKEVAAAVGKFSDLLLQHKLIRGEADEDALMTAMKSVARHLATTEASETPSPKVSPQKFIKNTFTRMNEYSDKIQSWVDNQRKMKHIEEMNELQHKPKINQNSRKLTNNIPPLHERVEDVVRHRSEMIKGLQKELESSRQQQEKSELTFKPNINVRGRRTPAEFTEQAYTWQKKVEQERQKSALEKAKEELAGLTLKPSISSKSRQLANERSKTPIFERLYNDRYKLNETSEPSFRPALCPMSHKLAERDRSKNVYSRLYEMSKKNPPYNPINRSQTPPPSSKPRPPPRKDRNESLYDSSMLNLSYRVNTSRGTVFDQDLYVNEIKYSPNISMLVSSLRED